MSNKNLTKFFGLLFIILPGFHSCDDPEAVDPVKARQELLEKNAAHNNVILPGSGNYFVEKDLIANSPAQLLSVLEYNALTFAYFGSVNGSGALEEIHAVVMSDPDNSESYITEIFPAQNIIRRYLATNNVKSSFVLEAAYIGGDQSLFSIIEMNWQNGTFSTLASILLENGVPIASTAGRAKALQDDPNVVCPQPEGTVEHFACYAESGQLHLVGEAFAELVADTVVDVSEWASKLADGEEKFDQHFPDPEKIDDLEPITEKIDSPQKGLENQYKVPNAEGLDALSISPFFDDSYLYFSEVLDGNKKLKISAIVKESSQATNKEIDVLIILLAKDTDQQVMTSLQHTDPETGRVTFTIDPLLVPELRKFTQLDYKISIPKMPELPPLDGFVTMKWIKPGLGYNDLQQLSSPVPFKEKKKTAFALMDLPTGLFVPGVDYSQDVSIRNNTNANISVGKTNSADDFSLELTTTDFSAVHQETSFDVFFKDTLLQQVAATLEAILPNSLEHVSGNDQEGSASQALADSIKVRVFDLNGAALKDIEVLWSVTSGGGQVSSVKTVTNSKGTTGVKWTLGAEGTVHEVEAKVVRRDGSESTYVFSATVGLPNNYLELPSGEILTFSLGGNGCTLRDDTPDQGVDDFYYDTDQNSDTSYILMYFTDFGEIPSTADAPKGDYALSVNIGFEISHPGLANHLYIQAGSASISAVDGTTLITFSGTAMEENCDSGDCTFGVVSGRMKVTCN